MAPQKNEADSILVDAEEEERRLQEVTATYRQLFDNRAEILDKCGTAEEKTRCLDLQSAAYTNFLEAVAYRLRKNSPIITKIGEDLAQANQQIAKMLADLKNISKFLNLVEKAVRLGAALVTLG